jgi:hypothetical protein
MSGGSRFRPGVASFWGVEGGANLVSYELIRQLAGIGLDSNYDWRNPPASPVAEFYALRAQPGTGDFNAGYDNAMGFLRDLVIRRVRSGEPVDRALREVDWTLSHAADDRTENARFQDHASLRVWDLPADHPGGWHPVGVLSARNPSVTAERESGNTDYLHLHDDGEGLTFSLSSDVPVQWKLIRTR